MRSLRKVRKVSLAIKASHMGYQKVSFASVLINDDVGDDKSFTDWNGTIIGPANTNFDNRIYFLTIKCGANYPMQPPEVSFNSKINLPCVN